MDVPLSTLKRSDIVAMLTRSRTRTGPRWRTWCWPMYAKSNRHAKSVFDDGSAPLCAGCRAMMQRRTRNAYSSMMMKPRGCGQRLSRTKECGGHSTRRLGGSHRRRPPRRRSASRRREKLPEATGTFRLREQSQKGSDAAIVQSGAGRSEAAGGRLGCTFCMRQRRPPRLFIDCTLFARLAAQADIAGWRLHDLSHGANAAVMRSAINSTLPSAARPCHRRHQERVRQTRLSSRNAGRLTSGLPR